MNKKITGTFVCILLIVTALSAAGATNVQTIRYLIENNKLEPCTITPIDSNGNIAIKIVGKITNVNDPDNLLGGTILIGDRITGKYNYDSGTPDSVADPKIGAYEYTTSNYGIELKAGGFVFKTDPNDVDYSIHICDGHYFCDYWDEYRIYSDSNLQLSNGIDVDRIIWFLTDSTGNALSSDALPTIPPILSDWDENRLAIMGYHPMFVIRATVTRATLSRGNTRDEYFNMQPNLFWLLEHFPMLERLLNLIR
ncbi:MAG: hypothetical protein JSU91_00075 [Thermoplasmatales archaeon]|nr:MAG: hypothetical protein JSU91_00075 [Thermoplasmatales archaeon]